MVRQLVGYMWPDLCKGIFHPRPTYQLWLFITSIWLMLLTWNLVSRKHPHRWTAGENFSFVCLSIITLWSFKFIELDVWKTPVRKSVHMYCTPTQLHNTRTPPCKYLSTKPPQQIEETFTVNLFKDCALVTNAFYWLPWLSIINWILLYVV